MTRGSYNRDTLNDLSVEGRYAEIAISEVKKFISILFGVLFRFYMPVVKFQDLQDMKDDLIEVCTSATVSGELSELLVKLCRMVTQFEEEEMAKKFEEFKDLTPELIGISDLFTLN